MGALTYLISLAFLIGAHQYVYVDATAIVPFNTNDSTGASANPTTAGTIKIFKAISATPRSSTVGITYTPGFYGVGAHQVSIDTSSNADVGFYAAGNTYGVMLSGGVVDTRTVNAVIGTFYLGAPLSTSSVTSVGDGPDICTLSFDTAGGVPIADAVVWIATDAAGTLKVPCLGWPNSQYGITNALGKVQYSLTDLKTYYMWMRRTGYTSISAQSFVAHKD